MEQLKAKANFYEAQSHQSRVFTHSLEVCEDIIYKSDIISIILLANCLFMFYGWLRTRVICYIMTYINWTIYYTATCSTIFHLKRSIASSLLYKIVLLS